MKKLLLTTTAILGLCAGMALATPMTDQIVAGLQSQGFNHIEIAQGLTQLKVEAIRDTTKIEIIYDVATGAILKQETSAIADGEDATPGIEINDETDDFIDVVGEDVGGGADDGADVAETDDSGADGIDDSVDEPDEDSADDNDNDSGNDGVEDSSDDHGDDVTEDAGGDDGVDSGDDVGEDSGDDHGDDVTEDDGAEDNGTDDDAADENDDNGEDGEEAESEQD